MRLLVIGRAYPEEGTGMIGLFEMEQAIALARAGHDVTYGFVDNRSIKVIRKVGGVSFTEKGVSVRGLILPIGGMPKALFDKIKTRMLIKLIYDCTDGNRIKFDAVYVHFPSMIMTKEFLIYLKKNGIPLFCTEHWSKAQTCMLTKREIEILNASVGLARKFWCVSDDLRQSVLQMLADEEDAAQVDVMPNMVDEQLFYYSPIHGDQTKKGKKYTFTLIGRLIKSKRFDFAIDAFAEAHFAGHVRMQIIGDGPERERLNKYRLDKNKELVLLGWQKPDKVACFLRESDCYITASNLETFCLPVAEAWMCGLPCIALLAVR